jgi:hypothetical protein
LPLAQKMPNTFHGLPNLSATTRARQNADAPAPGRQIKRRREKSGLERFTF